MTITLSLPVALTAVGLATLLVTHIVMLARWSQRLQSKVEEHDGHINQLRHDRHAHAQDLTVLKHDVAFLKAQQ